MLNLAHIWRVGHDLPEQEKRDLLLRSLGLPEEKYSDVRTPYPFYDGEIALEAQAKALNDGVRVGESAGLHRGRREASSALGSMIKANGVPSHMKDTIIMEFSGNMVERLIWG